MKKLVSSIAVLAATIPVAAGDFELTGSAGFENRLFFEKGALPGQISTYQPSLELEADIRWQSSDQAWDVVVIPYTRLDAKDGERSHFDLREAYVRWTGDEWTVRAGLGKVFWGVAESVHLVDIINQSDSVEDLDNEDKLGQPMFEISTQRDWGQITAYVMPGFRKRTFPGADGRLRPALPVDNDLALFDEGTDDDNDVDFALRYSHYFGDWDVGLSFFHGANREARFIPNSEATALVPHYDDITQFGVDIQYTRDAWLWKFEALIRDSAFETYAAAVGGFEYTFYGVSDGGADLGLLLEFQYDGRSDNPAIAPFTVADNDVFVGARYALNDADDTSILAGLVTDVSDASMSGIIEATKRFGENWVAEIEGRFFMNVDPDNVAFAFKDDSHIMFRLTRYF